MDIAEALPRVGLIFVPFLFALCFHEYAHGWVARKLGDNTAQIMGRLSMNPLVHLDILGTVILPLAAIFTNIPFFGWAKPVPVNERNFKHPRKDMFWVAAAGPASNMLLAFIAAIGFACAVRFIADPKQQRFVLEFMNVFLQINLSLAFFNLLPVHPLDGGKVLARFLPNHINDQLEANQHVTSMLLLVVFIGGGLRILGPPIYWMHNQMLAMAHMLVL